MSRLTVATLALLLGFAPCRANCGNRHPGLDLDVTEKSNRHDAKPPALVAMQQSPAANTPASHPKSAAVHHLKVRGKVKFLTGEALSGASVWMSSLGSPAQHLVEGKTDSSGSFALEFDLAAQAPGSRYFVLGAKHPSSIEGREIIQPGNPAHESELTLLLRKSQKSLDEPDLDEAKDWLLRRLGGSSHGCVAEPASICREYESVFDEYLRGPADSMALLQRILPLAEDPKLLETRLLTASMLMRLGAWSSAAKMLDHAPPGDARLPERSFLQGVLWNFLRRPDEAVPALQRTVSRLPKDAMAELELGRAYVLDQDPLNAQNTLDAALSHRASEPRVRYLLIQALLTQDETEAAYAEARALSKCFSGNTLPPEAKDLVAEVLGRLGESFNVITYPVSELVRVVPGLRDLESNASQPPGGLEPFLKEVGARIASFFQNFTDTGATEIIRQTRQSAVFKATENRTVKCRYIIQNESTTGHYQLQEYRGDMEGHPLRIGGIEQGFMVTTNFVSLLTVFLPDWQRGITFRFLGQQQVAGRLTYVIGFAQRPSVSPPMTRFGQESDGTADLLHLQGVAWITADDSRVLRLHSDLLYPLPDQQLNRLAADIDYRPRRVGDSEKIFWLPVGVTVKVDWKGRRLRNQHILSDYVLFNVETRHRIRNAENSVSR